MCMICLEAEVDAVLRANTTIYLNGTDPYVVPKDTKAPSVGEVFMAFHSRKIVYRGAIQLPTGSKCRQAEIDI